MLKIFIYYFLFMNLYPEMPLQFKCYQRKSCLFCETPTKEPLQLLTIFTTEGPTGAQNRATDSHYFDDSNQAN